MAKKKMSAAASRGMRTAASVTTQNAGKRGRRRTAAANNPCVDMSIARLGDEKWNLDAACTMVQKPLRKR